jgi:hypothetical protein
MYAGLSQEALRPGPRRNRDGSPASFRPHPRLVLWLSGLAFAALLHFGVPAFWNWKHVVSSSGGRYFIHRVVIPVPAFQQNDPRWSLQLLGDTFETLGQAGCAVTSAAMVLADYGVDTDPERLNNYLIAHGGYVGDGLLVWEKPAELGLGQVQKAYEDLPSYALLDQNLLERNPVIVRLTLPNGRTHFVVIVGKRGWNYLVQDPARAPDEGIYPLKDLTGRIEALRFYRIVPLLLPSVDYPTVTDIPGAAPSFGERSLSLPPGMTSPEPGAFAR